MSTDINLAERILEQIEGAQTDDPRRVIVIETRSEYRGNRLTHRFYPEHWAQVQLARHNAMRYGD